ncbi:ABC transporter permease [Alkalicoccobacillus murimartini]|uniref:ABC transport system permease protein n=1 Tax=Alkalicoccobacillus murimartini TaxID=171685 RepID=A0ABT9YKD7_9BACI|nr:ABC transporter permease [Alkalicoccobacillus murimartini]MDQ0208048.1 putative ABC transport system permease protein [Alkalicoccobacillus murimartini]
MLENIKLSFQSIFSHKMRSTLTMLGVIIGIAAIIAIVSMIQGQSEVLKSNIIGLGNNTIQVSYEDMMEGGEGDYWGGDTYISAPPVTEETLDMIKSDPLVDTIALFHKSWNATAYHELNFAYPESYAVDSTYFDMYPVEILEGRMLREDELNTMSQLIMINEDARTELFDGGEAIGKTIDLGGIPFKVAGVFTDMKMDNDSFYFDDWTEPKIFMSKMIWPLIEGFDAPTQILVKAVSPDAIQEAGELTASYLNSDLPSYETANYRIPDLQSIAEDLEAANRTFALLLGGIASISLLVGGIGVMNIMLVSVTERTREIGIKKALGAKRYMILMQFLTEAIVLTSVGGALGVLLGIGAAKIVSNIMNMPFYISITAVVGALVFSMLVGVIFGLLPSIKASKLQPVDALKYE